MTNDTQNPAAKVHEYEQSVIAYEKLNTEIAQFLSARGGHSENLSDDEFIHYRELADRRDNAYNLMKTLENLDLEQPVPTLWPQFEGLRFVPVLALRGENSDLLSAETLAEMGRRHPRFEAHIVAGQGHAPLLLDAPTIARIAQFVAAVDPARASTA